jgi:CBS-domain-containing membrane protein
MHPIVPIALDMGVGFAILSYADRLSITATADPALVPDAERLPAMLTVAMEELRACLGGVGTAASTAAGATPVEPAAKGKRGAATRPAASTLTTVADLMSRDPISIAPHDLLSAAWRAMREHRIRHLPVVERDGRLVGLVTHRDLLAAAQSSITFDREEDRVRLLGAAAAFEIMETHLSTVRATVAAHDAGSRMVRHKIGCLPVVDDDGRLVGIVTEEDFMDLASKLLEEQIGAAEQLSLGFPSEAVKQVAAVAAEAKTETKVEAKAEPVKADAAAPASETTPRTS